MLFNEPKLLKRSALADALAHPDVSVLFNEPKLLKQVCEWRATTTALTVSVLFNEPKLLKFDVRAHPMRCLVRFSALQRAEIAEM